jgi:hypothetical protein
MLKVNGVKAVSKYSTKPQNMAYNPTPIEILDRLLAGIDVPFNPTMDIQGFLTLAAEFMQNDELNGQFGPDAMAVINAKAQEAQALMEALQQQAATAAVQQQQNMNTMASMQPGNMQQVQLTQAPQQGEGG